MMNGSSQIALEIQSITIQSGHGVTKIKSGTFGTTITICGLYLNMAPFNLLFETSVYLVLWAKY